MTKREFRRIEHDSLYGKEYVDLTQNAYCCATTLQYPNPNPDWDDEYKPPTLIEIQDFIDWLEQQTAYACALKAKLQKDFP